METSRSVADPPESVGDRRSGVADPAAAAGRRAIAACGADVIVVGRRGGGGGGPIGRLSGHVGSGRRRFERSSLHGRHIGDPVAVARNGLPHPSRSGDVIECRGRGHAQRPAHHRHAQSAAGDVRAAPFTGGAAHRPQRHRRSPHGGHGGRRCRRRHFPLPARPGRRRRRPAPPSRIAPALDHAPGGQSAQLGGCFQRQGHRC